MLQVNSKTFSKKRMSLKVAYGKKIVVSKEDMAEKLYEHFKASKKKEIHMNFKLDHCAICESKWSNGNFATEKLLLVPKNKDALVNGVKPVTLHVTLPRVVCMSCSATLAEEDGVDPSGESATTCTLSSAWRVMLESKEKAPKKSGQQAQGNSWKNNKNQKAAGRPFTRQGMSGVSRFPPVRSPPTRNGAKSSPNLRPSGSPPNYQTTPPKLADRMQGMSLDQEKGNLSPRSAATSGDGERRERVDSIPKSIADQKGFLVCTQLVKTGGADKAGLQVGDIFIKLGYMDKENFQGLKSLALYIRGSANKSIEAIVLRNMNQESQRTKRSFLVTKTHDAGAMFQKRKIHLTPLKSHDADGGGVLGAVMNLWPVPQPAGNK